MRKKVGGVILALVLSMVPSVTAQANSLSIIPGEDVTGIPQQIYEQAEVIGHELNICPELLLAIAEKESRFQADAENGSCKGLMQVSVKIHEQRFTDMGWTTSDWDNSYINMYVAASYLAELFEQYEDCGIVLGLYHGERNAVSRGEAGQLSSYVTEILERSEELERIANK